MKVFLRIELAKLYYLATSNFFHMFGMAFRFLQLNLDPLNIFKTQNPTQNNQNQNNQENLADEPVKKKITKSSQIITSDHCSEINYPDFSDFKDFKRRNIFQQKPVEGIDQHHQICNVNIQQLKQSQLHILQKFKKSIQSSLIKSQSFQNACEEKETQTSPQNQKNERVQGLMLSKIEELSQEYLQYSVMKSNLNSLNKAKLQKIDKNKAASCELIKSIVKSVLFQGQNDNTTNQQNQLKLSYRSQKNFNKNNLETYESSKQSFEVKQPATEFIKELFFSLGLINQSEKQSNSLQELTSTAKKNFNQLKGNDYVEKLHEMLHSVDNINKNYNDKILASNFSGTEQKRIQLPKLVLSSKDLIQENKQSENLYELAYPKNQVSPKQEKITASRKQILIKRQSDKKVKLVSPETFSELQSRRNQIQNQIQQAMEVLTSTRRVRKYAFDSTKINEVILNFSLDFRFMSYKHVNQKFFSEAKIHRFIKNLCSCTKSPFDLKSQKEDQSISIVPLNWSLVNVSKGIKTKNFIKFEEILSNSEQNQSQSLLNQKRCLSLLFKNRTYDFQFQSQEIRDIYFMALKIMIKSSFQL